MIYCLSTFFKKIRVEKKRKKKTSAHLIYQAAGAGAKPGPLLLFFFSLVFSHFKKLLLDLFTLEF
jgi:hypothetical protein